MIGTGYPGHFVDRQGLAARLQEFLQTGFLVAGAGLGDHMLQRGREPVPDAFPAGLQPAVQPDGAQDRLQGSRQNVFPPRATSATLALAESYPFRNAHLAGDLGQATATDQARAQAAQFALGKIGKPVIQQLSDHQPQDRITEKLEPLVVGSATAAVGQGQAQQLGIRERIAAEFARLAAELSHRRYARQSRELS